MSNLERIANGTINRWGGIDGADYRPTGFTVSNNGVIRDGYTPVAGIDGAGNICGGYGMPTGLRVSNGMIRNW